MSAIVARLTAIVSRGCRITTASARAYQSVIAASPRSVQRYAQPCCCAEAGRSSHAHIMGVSVSDTTIDTPIATESVTANSRNSRPTIPPMQRIGMKTATSDTLIDSTVNPISRAPAIAAAIGFMPASRYREMFSSTPMASSTTKPVAIVSAISDRLSRL